MHRSKMSDFFLSSDSHFLNVPQGHAGLTEDVLSEMINLNFAKIEVSYQPQKSDGGKDGGAIKFGWNIRENIKI